MDKGGQTVSATEFAALSGVTRERLRTWERRHGFPTPVRSHGGARRYAVEDVSRVVAVRRAVESGTPVTAAITAAQVPSPGGISLSARGELAEVAPVPVVALSGPEPLRVEYVNAVVRQRPGAPQAGDDLLARAPWFAQHEGIVLLRRLFVEDQVAMLCEHPDWTGGMRPGVTGNSIAYRLPYEDGAPPLVGLIGIDTAAERRARADLAASERARRTLEATMQSERRLANAVAGVIDLFRHQHGVEGLAAATGLLVRTLGISDAAVAPYMAGQIVLGRSHRGLLGPDMVTVVRHDELATGLRDGVPTWLRPGTAAAFGAPKGVFPLAVPILSAGESLGVVMLVYQEQRELSDAEQRLLSAAAGTIGFALLRERSSE